MNIDPERQMQQPELQQQLEQERQMEQQPALALQQQLEPQLHQAQQMAEQPARSRRWVFGAIVGGLVLLGGLAAAGLGGVPAGSQGAAGGEAMSFTEEDCADGPIVLPRRPYHCLFDGPTQTPGKPALCLTVDEAEAILNSRHPAGKKPARSCGQRVATVTPFKCPGVSYPSIGGRRYMLCQ